MQRYAFIIYLILILILTVIPLQRTILSDANNVYILSFRLDYLIHTAIFLPWVLLCEFSFGNIGKYRKLIFLIIGVIVAIGAEYIQMAIPYRAFNINDILFNIAGVLLGSIVWLIYEKGKQNKENNG